VWGLSLSVLPLGVAGTPVPEFAKLAADGPGVGPPSSTAVPGDPGAVERGPGVASPTLPTTPVTSREGAVLDGVPGLPLPRGLPMVRQPPDHSVIGAQLL
jgi:hypothetical protein